MELALSDIPKEKGCFTQAWGISEESPEVWIDIKKQPEPALPNYPELCQEWVNIETLYQTNDLPELFSSISQKKEIDHDGEIVTETKTLNLEDHPDIMEAWNEYLETKWLPWQEEHNRWEKIRKVYTKLFTLHQAQLKLGEEYELT